MEERRRSVRHRTYKGAQIAPKDDRAAIECIVRNLSDSGACLNVESPIVVPDEFYLIFENGGTRHTCHVVWRGENQMGVMFR
jgi:PilZ domain